MRARWQSIPAPDVADGLILFDGVCVLCSGWVRFVIERDAAERFRFVPIQSPYGSALASRTGGEAQPRRPRSAKPLAAVVDADSWMARAKVSPAPMIEPLVRS